MTNSEKIPTKDGKTQQSESARIETIKKYERPLYQEESSKNNPNSGQSYSNFIEAMPIEIAQNNYSGTESENVIYNENVGNMASGGQNDAREYSGQNTTTVPYQVNYPTNGNVQDTSEYGSHPGASTAYLNSNIRLFFFLNFFIS